jgi:hypothetical protein
MRDGVFKKGAARALGCARVPLFHGPGNAFDVSTLSLSSGALCPRVEVKRDAKAGHERMMK